MKLHNDRAHGSRHRPLLLAALLVLAGVLLAREALEGVPDADRAPGAAQGAPLLEARATHRVDAGGRGLLAVELRATGDRAVLVDGVRFANGLTTATGERAGDPAAWLRPGETRHLVLPADARLATDRGIRALVRDRLTAQPARLGDELVFELRWRAEGDPAVQGLAVVSRPALDGLAAR